MAEAGHGIPFAEGVRVWARVAALSFGGPAGQIAVMHRIIVDEKRWVGDRRFLHALNYCMLLPGPEAHQLAIYLGWLLHGVRGGVVAGVLFVLPGFLAILALSFIYAAYGQTGLVAGLFFGLKAAVLALVAQAVARVGSRTLRNTPLQVIAALAFLAIFFLRVPFPAIILVAGLVGYLGGRAGLPAFSGGGGHGPAAAREVTDASSALGPGVPDHARPGRGPWSRLVGLFAALWLAPVVALLLFLGPDNIFARLGLFFSQMAVVTFGGAYAVLAYVAQEAVQHYGWLRPGEMLDGLGMAEATPGPLIIVLEFVGFLAALRHSSGMDPWLAALLGAVLVTWVTFLPSFLWIFLGAPFIERLRDNRPLTAALTAVTAAVVGVILNLAIWLGLHLLFRETQPWSGFGLRLDLPVPSSIDPVATVLALASYVALARFKLGLGIVLLSSSLLGLLWFALGGML